MKGKVGSLKEHYPITAHITTKLRFSRVLKVVAHMKGKVGSLKEHYPITAHITTKLRFSTGCCEFKRYT